MSRRVRCCCKIPINFVIGLCSVAVKHKNKVVRCATLRKCGTSKPRPHKIPPKVLEIKYSQSQIFSLHFSIIRNNFAIMTVKERIFSVKESGTFNKQSGTLNKQSETCNKVSGMRNKVSGTFNKQSETCNKVSGTLIKVV